MAQGLYIRQMLLSDLDNFTYILADKVSGAACVIDPAAACAVVMDVLQKEKFSLQMVLLTHGHYDHVVDVDKFDVPVHLSAAEADLYLPAARQLVRTPDGAKIRLGPFVVECLHTPGHTPGCQCFLVDGNLFTGDTLFMGAVGRTDFPGGDARQLFHSLQRLKSMPATTRVWPGHNYGSGRSGTIAEMKRHNPYFACEDIGQFVSYFS